jgi:hypothetical protein
VFGPFITHRNPSQVAENPPKNPLYAVTAANRAVTKGSGVFSAIC